MQNSNQLIGFKNSQTIKRKSNAKKLFPTLLIAFGFFKRRFTIHQVRRLLAHLVDLRYSR